MIVQLIFCYYFESCLLCYIGGHKESFVQFGIGNNRGVDDQLDAGTSGWSRCSKKYWKNR
ncbi:hypothetical protein BpHYR1_049238 [Brachionus plicatilis]|uniref:Uncharacterized protein n=1 Tax=Brachionus plicatilis TaxID=10195 RepID=A0A3M7RWZ8_BRAPC|nr:hypothetical protein BpHYR1_049238 [Brachionus plicatilis]